MLEGGFGDSLHSTPPFGKGHGACLLGDIALGSCTPERRQVSAKPKLPFVVKVEGAPRQRRAVGSGGLIVEAEAHTYRTTENARKGRRFAPRLEFLSTGETPLAVQGDTGRKHRAEVHHASPQTGGQHRDRLHLLDGIEPEHHVELKRQPGGLTQGHGFHDPVERA